MLWNGWLREKAVHSENHFFKFNEKTIGSKLHAESPSAGKGATFKGECSIGAFSYVGARSTLSHVHIGRYCSIAEDVTIGASEHPLGRLTTSTVLMGTPGPFLGSVEFERIWEGKSQVPVLKTFIGHDVWIGAGAYIRRGVKVGNGAVIGARAVVTKDVGAYEIAAGVPAKVIRLRFNSEIIERLQRLSWWEYDLEPVREVIAQQNIEDVVQQLEKLVSENRLSRLAPTSTTLTHS